MSTVERHIHEPHETVSATRNFTPFVSVVVPAYNEEAVIQTTCERLQRVMNGQGVPYELLFINDGSKDRTIDILIELSHQYPEVKVIDFSRNFGHQVAVTAGIDAAGGDVVILIDADLQDPPELIEQFLEKWREGYDVVYAVRERREGETWFKKLTAKMFYRTLARFTDIDIPVDTGDFRLMNRNVVDSLIAMPEKHRFVRGLVAWVGFRQIGVPYVRSERLAGESKYPLKKMIRFSVDGITSFSFKPLQLSTKFGFVCALLGFVSIIGILLMKIFTNWTVQGWASLMVVSLFLGGIQLVMLGILGEYVGRIYDEVRNRPLYLTKGMYNFDDQDKAEHPSNRPVRSDA